MTSRVGTIRFFTHTESKLNQFLLYSKYSCSHRVKLYSTFAPCSIVSIDTGRKRLRMKSNQIDCYNTNNI